MWNNSQWLTPCGLRLFKLGRLLYTGFEPRFLAWLAHSRALLLPPMRYHGLSMSASLLGLSMSTYLLGLSMSAYLLGLCMSVYLLGLHMSAYVSVCRESMHLERHGCVRLALLRDRCAALNSLTPCTISSAPYSCSTSTQSATAFTKQRRCAVFHYIMFNVLILEPLCNVLLLLR